MHPRTSAKVRSGIKLGVGAGLFLVAGILLSDGMDGIFWSGVRPGEVHWHDFAGWAELAVAFAILVPTANVWWQLLCGYMVFGLIKSAILILTGSDIVSSQPLSRLQGVFLAIFCLGTILSLLRLARDKVTLVDRVALTLFIFAFLWQANQASFSSMSSGMVIAFVILLIAWLLAWRRGAARFPFSSLEAV